VEDAHALADRAVLAPDLGEVLGPVPRAVLGTLAPARPARREIVDALPAVPLAEHRPQVGQPVVERAHAERPPPLALVVWEAQAVEIPVDLARLLRDVG